MSANDRFQVIESIPGSPGHCFICLSVTGGPFIDPRVDDPWLGMFVICKRCVVEMVNTLNAYTQVAVDIKISENEQQKLITRLSTESFKQRIQEVEVGLSDLIRSFFDSVNSAIPSVNDVSSLSIVESVSEGTGTKKRSRVSADSVAEQTVSTTEQQGPDDISADSGDGSSLTFKI